MKGRDVFAVLPTGYRKSLCFGCLPLVFDKLLEKEGEDKSSLVLDDAGFSIRTVFLGKSPY